MAIIEDDIYLKGEDLKSDETSITIVGEGVYEEVEFESGKKKILNLPIEIKPGLPRVWSPNKTSREVLVRRFTNDTTKWVGKTVTLIKKVQNVRGVEKEVIYVKQ